jgi:iron complex transport system substrate-binding protein
MKTPVLCPLWLVFGLLLFTACARPPADVTADNHAFDAHRDYFPDKLTVKHARGFSVEYARNYKIVRTNASAPDKDLPQARATLVLVERGTPAPKLEGELAGAHVITIPARAVAVTNNDELAKLRALGLADRVVATGGASVYPEIHTGHRSGKIQKIGNAGSVNLETVVTLAPDLLVIFSWMGAQQANVEQARWLGLPAVAHHPWLEPTPLGHAEWIKFIALFFNQERRAEEFFNQVERDYLELAARAKASTNKPSAIWVTCYAAIGWQADRNSWGARFIEDAGAINALADSGTAYQVRMAEEQVVNLASQADFWLTLNPRQKAVTGLPLKAFNAAAAGRIYDPFRVITEFNQPDYFGLGMIRVDLMLRDLVSIFHPETLPDHRLFFFQRQT